ncbi:hypothetical protein [Halomonas shantousis]
MPLFDTLLRLPHAPVALGTLHQFGMTAARHQAALVEDPAGWRVQW